MIYGVISRLIGRAEVEMKIAHIPLLVNHRGSERAPDRKRQVSAQPPDLQSDPPGTLLLDRGSFDCQSRLAIVWWDMLGQNTFWIPTDASHPSFRKLPFTSIGHIQHNVNTLARPHQPRYPITGDNALGTVFPQASRTHEVLDDDGLGLHYAILCFDP
ncbi:hypothetical protein WG66_003199, partial [Moniliophthora roreri]